MGFVSDVRQKINAEITNVVKRVEESTQKCGDIKMAYIPAGPFKMGSEDGEWNERPVRDIYVSGFCADRYETTIEQFENFLASRPKSLEEYVLQILEKLNGSKQLSIYMKMSWEDADVYCKAQGKRLPTEAEWEKMAKGGINATYATADTTLRCGENANCDSNRTTDVDAFLPNAYGIYGLTGGMGEWVGDWYSGEIYANMPSQDPTGPTTGECRVLRGKSRGSDHPYSLRTTLRHAHRPGDHIYDVGVRCVRSVDLPNE